MNSDPDRAGEACGNPAWQSRCEVAVRAAREAGRLALRRFEGDLAVERKPDQSLVTAADREAEQLLRSSLLAAFPGDAFFGEESGDHPGTSGFRWIVDPIDGTHNFARGIPLWATLVGLEHHGEQVAGVAEVPLLGHTYHAVRGGGAYRNGRRLHVSGVADLGEAILFHPSLSWFVRAGRMDAFLRLLARTHRQRGLGDFYGFVLVAQGSGELMVGHNVHFWDVAALRVLVEEAGGRFTDWDGNPTIARPDVVASNGRLHDEALRILQGRTP